ncbi:MAG: transketolase C-terminal domain-containing protein [Candidatus ainarchaeum sp.]|nr:transketolase C-terminal domain-containing protein [Candidatus ainarchaeum sp.]MDD5096288.1 transketolase C-terminal domain-containing protein [Candidatus ainarchaeum sp.]
MNMHATIDFPAKGSAASRDGFGKALVELGGKDQDVWVLTADVSESTRTHWFAEKFPKRFVQVGVAEQNMAGVAAGIAACGKKAFVSAYGVFSPGRNWDQIRVSVCYNDVPVVFHGSHTGITVGPDGASHQALEDIAITRVIPNIVVLAPADVEEARKATIAAYEAGKPAYIRTCREKMPSFTTPETPFRIGEANAYREGTDAAVFACGPMVYESLLAAEKLNAEGISCAVVDCHTIKPIDKKAVVEWARKAGLIVTVEEHQVTGGMGSAVAEVVAEEYPIPVKRHGIYDQFCESGSALELIKKYKLDAEGIASVVKESMAMKKR